MIKRILNSTFVKLSSIVFVGNLFSQGIIFIAFALFARYFDKTDIGIYTVFISLTTLLSVPATGRYELAIMLPTHKKDASALLLLALSLAALFSLLLFGVFNLFSLVDYISKLERIHELILLLPIGVFLMAAFQSFTMYNNKQHLFKLNAVAKIIQAATMLLISVFIAQSIGFHAKALVLGWLLSQGIMFCFYLLFFLLNLEKISRTDITDLMRLYKRYPTISLASNVVNTFSAELPNYFIPVFWGANVQTLYAYASRVAAIPFNFIGSSIGQVFYSVSSKIAIENREELLPYLKKTTTLLFAISVVLFSIGIALSSFLFPIFFGKDYAEAVPYFNCLAISAIFVFVQSPISVISDIVNRLRPPFIFTVCSIIIKITVLLIAAQFLNNPVYMIALYAITTAGLSLFWILRLIKMAKEFSDRSQD